MKYEIRWFGWLICTLIIMACCILMYRWWKILDNLEEIQTFISWWYENLRAVSDTIYSRQENLIWILEPNKTGEDTKLEEIMSNYDTVWCDDEDVIKRVKDRFVWYDNWFCAWQDVDFEDVRTDDWPMFLKCEWLVVYEDSYTHWYYNKGDWYWWVMPYTVIKENVSDKSVWDKEFLDKNYVLKYCLKFTYVNKENTGKIVD